MGVSTISRQVYYYKSSAMVNQQRMLVILSTTSNAIKALCHNNYNYHHIITFCAWDSVCMSSKLMQDAESALITACQWGHVETARVLLDHGAIVDRQNKV